MPNDFKRPFYVGDTATPIKCRVYGEDGTLRTDIASATLRLINVDNADAVLLNNVACDELTTGIVEYIPGAGEITITADCDFIARFNITLDDGGVIRTPDYRGRLKVNR